MMALITGASSEIGSDFAHILSTMMTMINTNIVACHVLAKFIFNEYEEKK